MRHQTQDEAQATFDPLAIAERQIAILQQLEQASGQLRICRTATEIEQCRLNRQIAAVLHIEGAGMIDAELTQLEAFYRLGVRSIGPFWNLPNAFGTGVSGPFPGSPDTGPGLTPAGEALGRACNRRRIMIDVSHMNEKTFWQTAALSRAPLVATHSNAHAPARNRVTRPTHSWTPSLRAAGWSASISVPPSCVRTANVTVQQPA